jgi:hypothetical protein
MVFGVPGLRKLTLGLSLIALSVACLSCSGGKSNQPPSRVQFRAVISNSLHPVTTGVHVPALEIMNAATDRLSFSVVGLSSLTDLGDLDVASNKGLTVAYSPGDRLFQLVDNGTEQATLATAKLPDATQSFFLSTNTQHIYAAVQNAATASGVPGAVIQLSTITGAITATIPIPHVRYVVEVNRGTQILALSDNSGGFCSPESGVVTVIDPGNIGSSADPRIARLCGFAHPSGVGSTANLLTPLILECGAECGGTVPAAIIPLDLTTGTLGTPIPVPAATVAAGSGSMLYVAGTAPGTACSSGTAATSCGVVTAIDLSGAKAPVSAEIPDGYHDKMEITTDGQVVIGSHDCTEVITASETRGCLAVFMPSSGKVVIPILNGDVTGIAAIPGRNVFYAIQASALTVYDSSTGKPLPVEHQNAIVGKLVDVKVIDNAP